MNRRRMKKILNESDEQLTALEWLGSLHYQICNGGLEQACYNGYVDELLNNYDSAEAWVDALEDELSLETPEEKECVKAADMIAKAIDKIEYVQECPDCGGEGSWTEEDEDGESYTERCSRCDGNGEMDCDNAADVDFSVYNSWADDWDSKYYKEINSDLIDDATEQSHNHSRVLDMVQGVNENTKVSLTLKQLKRLVKESSKSGIKSFEDVQEGDIVRFADGSKNTLFVVFNKGPASQMVDYDDISGPWTTDGGDFSDDDPFVAVCRLSDGREESWIYGDRGVVADYDLGNVKNAHLLD